jgi:DNA-binding MarR family transcriptional regulator
MEDQGWIKRVISQIDKRKVLIFLTPEGLLKRNLVRDFLLEFNEKLNQRIPQKDLDGFFNTMNILDQVIDEVVNLDEK